MRGMNNTAIERSLSMARDNAAFVGLFVIVVLVSMSNEYFLTVDNILNVLRQTSINAILAVGMTFVILTAGIDLSVGSVLAFAGAVGAALVAAGTPVPVAVLAALLVGVGVGAASGVVVAFGRVQPFIATLVSMTMLRGATLVLTDGRPISTAGAPGADAFWFLGGGYVFGLPVPVLLALGVFLIAGFLLTQTRFGRYVYALGGSEAVAHLAGVNVNRVKILVYMVSGGLAAFAGVILTARLESAQPTAGLGYELDAIAAVVLGGTSLMGGKGRISGTLVGALIIGVLNNVLNLFDISSYYQAIAKGAVILLAVVVDSRSKSR